MLAAAAALVVLLPLHGDQWIADQVFAAEGGAWSLRQHPLTEGLIHRGGRLLSQLGGLAVFCAWLSTFAWPAARAWRRPLAVLLASVLLSTGLVAALKQLLPIDCPWDLARYGGSRSMLPPWPPVPADAAIGHCFPAAHASVGYAWLALYFFLSRVRPQWRLAGLAAGLGLGAVFGVSQQLRGAHFLSHDVVSLALCWLVALALDRAFGADARTPGARP